MALRRLRGGRRARGRKAAVTTMGAGGILAGAALAWLLSPTRGAERRERAGRVLHDAAARASAEARAVSTRAGAALHDAQGRLRSEAKAAVAGAGKLPERAREAADRGRLELEARGWSPREVALGVAGGALLGRALLGRGILRIPAGLLGLSILSRAAPAWAGARRRMERTGEAAREAAERLRAARGASDGGSHPRGAGPEVREGKSPSELEPGAATGRPAAASSGAAGRSGPATVAGWSAGADEEGSESVLSTPSTDDVRREGFDAPAAGAGVREAELGVVMPHEGAPPEGEAAPGQILGPDGEPVTRGEGGAAPARRDPGDDGDR